MHDRSVELCHHPRAIRTFTHWCTQLRTISIRCNFGRRDAWARRGTSLGELGTLNISHVVPNPFVICRDLHLSKTSLLVKANPILQKTKLCYPRRHQWVLHILLSERSMSEKPDAPPPHSNSVKEALTLFVGVSLDTCCTRLKQMINQSKCDNNMGCQWSSERV